MQDIISSGFPTSFGHADDIYLNALGTIRIKGEPRTDRTGVGTISLFGDIQMKFDLRRGFPLLTTKFVHFHSIVHELLWMLSGSTNVRYLKANGVRIWDAWVKPETAEYRLLEHAERIRKLNSTQLKEFLEKMKRVRDEVLSEEIILARQCALLKEYGIPESELSAGELGPVYGSQWRFWEDTRTIEASDWFKNIEAWTAKGYFYKVGNVNEVTITRTVDQIAKIEHQLKHNPDSRRIILSGWNVAMVDEMALPPCHTLAQWYVSTQKDEDGRSYLDCKLFMRSNDFFLGCPFNVAQYALLTEMFAHVAGMTPRYYFHDTGDAHIYQNHTKQVMEHLERPIKHHMPRIKIHGQHSSVLGIKASDIELIGYEYQPAIKAPVAV